MEQQSDISRQKNEERVGSKLRVLVEGLSDESDLLLQGRAEHQAPAIDGVILINDGEAEAGCFATIEIAEAHPYDLVGRVLETELSGSGFQGFRVDGLNSKSP